MDDSEDFEGNQELNRATDPEAKDIDIQVGVMVLRMLGDKDHKMNDLY